MDENYIVVIEKHNLLGILFSRHHELRILVIILKQLWNSTNKLQSLDWKNVLWMVIKQEHTASVWIYKFIWNICLPYNESLKLINDLHICKIHAKWLWVNV